MKSTLEQKIARTEAAIKSNTDLLNSTKEKLKALERELKTLNEEKNRRYASEFLKMISEKGLTTDEQKREFLLQVEKLAAPVASVSAEKDNSFSLTEESKSTSESAEASPTE